MVDCWVFFGQCLFVFQAAFVKFMNSRSASFGVRYPRAEWSAWCFSDRGSLSSRESIG